MKSDLPHVARGDSKIEWYTPPWLVGAVRTVMGEIDLDPASSDQAQELVQAKHYYTIETDGLAHPWQGRVFMNPPYTRKLIEVFADKWVLEWSLRSMSEGIVLCNNATETIWFQMLASLCDSLCTLRGRVGFWGAGAGLNKGLQGQVLLYYGRRVERFTDIMCGYGQVWELDSNFFTPGKDEVRNRVAKLIREGRPGMSDSLASGNGEGNSGQRTAARPDCTMAQAELQGEGG